ncbi:pimeloyl-ACP methyl ester carboxylesterase [Pseudochelatococcus lubricantis]|uniref:Pimeloyl-ACP methyl ester carboxylesterase n=1 Tax=Pseudochelatococcus lubricantis TaxID=1538102 RepID=A0ABX0UTK7_9HYPH|nr:pimeloyl-ACP methyl ester carboxylesterase [Pseudochelatococcus lubricantis]
MQAFSSDGVRINFIDIPARDGDGRPVLLIHGFASNHAVNWVNTMWTTTLGRAGYRVIALDNRGHGQSEKLYDPAAYTTANMAEDARRLLDHLDIERAAVIGYSMGARNTARLTVLHPERVAAAVLGGLGIHLVDGDGLPTAIAEAMEASSLEDLTAPNQRMFRAFAQQTGSDLRALAACIRGSRGGALTRAEVAAIAMPVLVAVGSRDPIAGSGEALAALLPHGRFLEIPGRDHNLAVGDKAHKQGVLAFFSEVYPAA